MPYNGSGTYTPPAADFPAITQTVISSSKYNNTINDVAAALTNAVTRDGQSPMTAALPMGGWPITGIALGSLSAPSISFTGLSGTGFSATASSLNMSLNGSPKVYLTATGLGVNITPSYEFSLSGASSILNMEIRNNSNLGVPGNATFLRFTDPSGTKSSLGSPGDGSSQFQIYTNMLQLSLFANNAERMRLTQSGDLLYGVSPTQGAPGLSIQTGLNLSFAEGSGTSYANIFRQTSSAATILANGYRYSANANAFASSIGGSFAKSAIGLGVIAGGITFYTDTATSTAPGNDLTPTERMRIGAAGNVTINAPSSGVALATSGSGEIINATGANAYLSLNTGGNGSTTGSNYAIQSQSSSSGFRIYDLINAVTRLQIGTAGNVTVNAPSSGVALAITAVSGSAAATFSGGSGAGGVIQVIDGQAGTRAWGLEVGRVSAGVFGIYDNTAAATRFQINTTGNVTINAPSSGTALAINSINTTTPYLNYVTGGTTTVGAAGGASALPANPVGYVTIAVGGTNYKMPYYNT
jgi:hypothetical protein